jgi:predicted ATPase
MFVHKDEETTFFIEEPELNLHPSLQRKLIEVMLSPAFGKQQFFIVNDFI